MNERRKNSVALREQRRQREERRLEKLTQLDFFTDRTATAEAALEQLKVLRKEKTS